MFRKILIPLDGSELSQRVLPPLRHMLDEDGVTSVVLARVTGPGEDEARAREELERLVGLLVASGVPAQARLAVGRDAGEEILRLAGELEVDLVAMATHGRSGLLRLVRGSVAERVLRGCTRPLLLCNPRVLQREAPQEGFQRILVPLDGSALAERVLEPAAALARIYDAELVLFKVENFATDQGRSALRPPAEVLATLEPLAARLRAQGLSRVSSRTALGSEVVETLEAIERLDVDLLALTTHGRSGVSRWWFGSVAEALVRAATCPLFVLRVS